ncbi:unnamed protein product, partial [Larinioides sclopetarius]
MIQSKLDCVLDLSAKIEGLKLDYSEITEDEQIAYNGAVFEKMEDDLEELKKMLCQWIVCLFFLWLPLVEMFGPMPQPNLMKGGDEKMKRDAMEMKDKAVVAKKELDEEDVTEQQFFECFADINCELGDAVREELFDCWSINRPEELEEYVLLFEDSPVGNFTKMSFRGINEDFCLLDDYDQRKVNEHFAAKGEERIKHNGVNSRSRDQYKMT